MSKELKPLAYSPRKGLGLIHDPGDTQDQMGRRHSALITSPELSAYRIVATVEKDSGLGDDIDAPSLIGLLQDTARAVNAGDLSMAEGMLMGQATALQSIFTRFAERGISQDSLQKMEAMMRISLRAQTQCRATLETLAAIKNPPVIYAKQANFSAGHQQINNAPQAVPIEPGQNQLFLGEDNGLVTGIPSTAIRRHPAMETVEQGHRATNTRG